MRAVVSARQFEFVVDEPPESGGLDTGPMPTEYLLGALAACYSIALAWVARKRDIALAPFTVDVHGTYDGPSVTRVEIVVHLDAPAPDEIDTLLERAGKVCYVSNTLRRQPTVEVVLARTAAAPPEAGRDG
jgi:uncharacterized OsmC-like protein